MALSLNFHDIQKRLTADGAAITTIDSHTAGEPTRLIVDGLPPIPGGTMAEKRIHFKTHLDGIRRRLTHEPRGNKNIFVAALTEPVSSDAAFGLIYMDPRRYPYLCGHATMGAVATLIETGVIPSAAEVRVDTPSGPMVTQPVMTDGRVTSVKVAAVPSFLHETDRTLSVEGFGTLRVSTVCVGGFFVMVASDQLPMPLAPEHSYALRRLGMAVIDAANHQLTVRHPLRSEVKTVDVVEFYEPYGKHPGKPGKSVVIYGEAHMDRSPCGTGTAAKLTLFHHSGELPVGKVYPNAGPLGTVFQAKILEETQVGDRPAVTVELEGSAYITGIHQFLVDPRDPFPEGFLL